MPFSMAISDTGKPDDASDIYRTGPSSNKMIESASNATGGNDSSTVFPGPSSEFIILYPLLCHSSPKTG